MAQKAPQRRRYAAVRSATDLAQPRPCFRSGSSIRDNATDEGCLLCSSDGDHGSLSVYTSAHYNSGSAADLSAQAPPYARDRDVRYRANASGRPLHGDHRLTGTGRTYACSHAVSLAAFDVNELMGWDGMGWDGRRLKAKSPPPCVPRGCERTDPDPKRAQGRRFRASACRTPARPALFSNSIRLQRGEPAACV